MAKLDWRVFNYGDLPQSIKDNLAIIDEAKAAINAELAQVKGEGWKAQHSYKLDFETGSRVFKLAFFKPKAKVVKAERPSMSLAEFVAMQQANGRGV
jgi:hypothetical protein